MLFCYATTFPKYFVARKITEVQHMDYWQRLKHLKMLSQERRMELYRVLYIWKILEGLVLNCGLEQTHSERRGREVSIQELKGSQRIKSLRENTLQVNGARTFKSLPKSLINLSRIPLEDFKMHLDK
jgi:hypothetical protein